MFDSINKFLNIMGVAVVLIVILKYGQNFGYVVNSVGTATQSILFTLTQGNYQPPTQGQA